MEINIETSWTNVTTISTVVGEKTVSVEIIENNGTFSGITLASKQSDSSMLTLNSVFLESTEEIAAAQTLLADILKKLKEISDHRPRHVREWAEEQMREGSD